MARRKSNRTVRWDNLIPLSRKCRGWLRERRLRRSEEYNFSFDCAETHLANAFGREPYFCRKLVGSALSSSQLHLAAVAALADCHC